MDGEVFQGNIKVLVAFKKYIFAATLPHCKPGQVEPAYIECGNGAAAMQVSQVNLFELGPTCRSHIQCKLVQLVRVYSVHTTTSSKGVFLSSKR